MLTMDHALLHTWLPIQQANVFCAIIPMLHRSFKPLVEPERGEIQGARQSGMCPLSLRLGSIADILTA